MGASFVGHGDGLLQHANRKKRAQMNIGQLHHAEAIKIGVKTGDGDVLFPETQSQAFDENTISDRRRGCRE